MQKISTMGAGGSRISKARQFTIGLDLAQLAPSGKSLKKECGWKKGDRGGPAKWKQLHGRNEEKPT